jgi:hypothetical protein
LGCKNMIKLNKNTVHVLGKSFYKFLVKKEL